MMLTVWLTLALLLGPQEMMPVTVYVTSVGAKDGFTDPDKGSADTVKDLKNQIGRKRSIGHLPSVILTEDRERATLIVIVLGRETTGSIGLGRDRMIRVKLLYAQHEAELTASRAGGAVGSAGAWREAAEKLAKQLDEWVKANRTTIEQRRQR